MSLGNDPRQPDPGLGPIVGQAANTGRTVAIVAGFVAAGGGLFLVLNSHRQQAPQRSLVPASAEGAAIGPVSAPPPPLRLPAPTPPVISAPPPPTPAPLSAPPLPPPAPAVVAPAAAQNDAQQRLHAPAVVVDLGGGTVDQAKPAPAAAGGPAPPTPSPLTAAANAQLGGEDQFAQRVEDATPSRAKATAMGALSTLIPQGTIIPGVLETAMDSDLPGYTRGVVSRDVRSFDGKTVLIPRGSRLIGQYKSAVSQGATRAFVIWTRIIRSDGVSIQIGSPGEDALGRAGLTGEVNRHFFARFGGSILLSVLNAGVASVARSPTTTISIGSPGAAVGAASAVQPDAIPPTIKVPQGSAINIFVARDLDFSDVKPVK